METMGLIYTLLDAADSAAAEHRYERAQALAAIAQARAMADIANALRDDDNNGVAHILHNMSHTLAVIARNTGPMDNGDEPAISLKQLRADVDWLQRYAERN
jgi:hypothetical protein